MKLKSKKGFTLVELLVVIAIIGILAVVAVPALFKNINKAKVADLEADYNAIKSASLSYYADNNTTPNISDLSDYMDSIPTKSSLGEGLYTIGQATIADTNSSLFLAIGDRKLKIDKNNDGICDEINTGSTHDCDESDCYEGTTGITITKDQITKLVNDMGDNVVFISKDGKNFTNITSKTDNIESYTGENCVIKLKLINNINL